MSSVSNPSNLPPRPDVTPEGKVPNPKKGSQNQLGITRKP